MNRLLFIFLLLSRFFLQDVACCGERVAVGWILNTPFARIAPLIESYLDWQVSVFPMSISVYRYGSVGHHLALLHVSDKQGSLTGFGD